MNEFTVRNGLIVYGNVTASNIQGTLLGSASYASQAQSASYAPAPTSVPTASFATTASFSLVVSTASFATTATTATSATTSSYAGTASVLLGSVSSALIATSASFASSSITSSFAQTAATALTANTATTATTATTSSNLVGFNYTNTGSILQTTNLQTTVIGLATGSYLAAFFDYAAVSGSNIRTGTVFGSWVNGQVVYSEVSTVDIGSTLPLTMSLGLSGGQIQLSASVSTVPWTVKSLVRYI